MRRIGKIFLQGLAAVLPLALTLYVLWWLGSSAESAFRPLLERVLPRDAYVPGLGVALGVGAVFGIGLLLRTWWLRALWSAFERLFERIPLIKSIYGSVRDLLRFFSDGDSKSRLDQVVLVTMKDPPMQLVGLITNESAAEVTGREQDSERVAVYLPMSYQLGGYMALLPREAIEPIDMEVEDALRTVVTAGMSRKGER